MENTKITKALATKNTENTKSGRKTFVCLVFSVT